MSDTKKLTLLELLQTLEPYLHDLEQDNVHEPSVGLNYDHKFGDAYRQLKELLESGQLPTFTLSQVEEIRKDAFEAAFNGGTISAKRAYTDLVTNTEYERTVIDYEDYAAKHPLKP